jgi:hypothetical protein
MPRDTRTTISGSFACNRIILVSDGGGVEGQAGIASRSGQPAEGSACQRCQQSRAVCCALKCRPCQALLCQASCSQIVTKAVGTVALDAAAACIIYS